MKENEQNLIEHNLIILSKQTLDLFLQQKNPGDLIALYTFYYYTAKWQKTNQPKCTDQYCMKGLNWGEIRFRKAKNELLKSKLIEKIIRRDNRNKITGWYIKLNYLWKKETLSKNPEIKDQENQGLNTYNANSKNAYSANSFLSRDKKKAISKKSPNSKSIYLNRWNSLKNKYPMLQQHKNPDTKLYQNTIKMINHLKKGTFENFVSIDPNFLKRNHIKHSLLTKKWTGEEILNCIDKLPKLFVNGIWPHDKSKLPKSLNTLIYNPRTNTSFFLLVATHPPVPIKQGKSLKQIDNEVDYKASQNGKWTTEQQLEHEAALEKEWMEQEDKRGEKR